uniref:Chitin synthase 6 (Class-V chitin synthase 6)) n=1 Tax=Ganoderma boninense TaxID=34458 RepID=A0A5K1K2Y6_9APHY|nr:Chitin synthase 6 (EC (Chitin-UDP acetyl-glucosaminyl transferase 6) (Class-V chitin synthase 6) [Ganoderma boninense]
MLDHPLTTLRGPSVVDEWLERGPVAQQPGSIGKLSTEVLDMIFQEILHDDKDKPGVKLVSCICLALGCKRLLVVGKRHILDGLARYYVRAAGCRLVCLGETTDATDQAPPGMLTADELKEIAETKVRAEDDEWAIRARADSEDPNVILERCLYEFAREFYESEAARKAKFIFSPAWVCMELWARPGLGPEWLLMERGDTVQLRDRKMADTLARWATYAPGPNVLLNLVKGEYVREAALDECGRVYNRVSLAHAMLSRVCYSIDPSGADEYCGEEFVGRFGRGPWAGDRFCIVSEREELPAPRDGCGFEEWRDVTEEVNRLLENIWKAMCWED